MQEFEMCNYRGGSSGNGDGDSGRGNPTNPGEPEKINLPEIDTTRLYKYPVFKELIVNLPAFLKNPKNANILYAIAYYTGFTKEKILNLMQPGVDPKVVVTNLPQGNTTTFANYDFSTKAITFHEPLINGLDAVNGAARYNAMVMLMTITTLHEFVHYRRDVNKLSVLVDG